MDFLAGYKTYIGIFITVLATASQFFGWGLGDLAGVQDSLIAFAGAVIAILGRAAVKTEK